MQIWGPLAIWALEGEGLSLPSTVEKSCLGVDLKARKWQLKRQLLQLPQRRLSYSSLSSSSSSSLWYQLHSCFSCYQCLLLQITFWNVRMLPICRFTTSNIVFWLSQTPAFTFFYSLPLLLLLLLLLKCSCGFTAKARSVVGSCGRQPPRPNMRPKLPNPCWKLSPDNFPRLTFLFASSHQISRKNARQTILYHRFLENVYKHPHTKLNI